MKSMVVNRPLARFIRRRAQSACDNWNPDPVDRGLTFSPTLVKGPNLQSMNRITNIHGQVDRPDLLIGLEIVEADR